MLSDSEIIGGRLKGWGIAVRIIGILVAAVVFFLSVGLSFGFNFAALSNQSQTALISALVDGLYRAGIILMSTFLSGCLIEGIGQIVINTGAAAAKATAVREQATAVVVDDIYRVDAPTIFGDPNEE